MDLAQLTLSINAAVGRCVTEEELAEERAALSPAERDLVDALPTAADSENDPEVIAAREQVRAALAPITESLTRPPAPPATPEPEEHITCEFCGEEQSDDESYRRHLDWHNDQAASPNPPRVVVVIEGGVVQEILSSVPVDAAVIDYDSEGADLEDITPIPQLPDPETGETETEDACASVRSVDVMPERVAELWAVIESPAPSAPPRVKLYECGICENLHPWEFEGDCRQDSERYASPEDYAQRHGIKTENIDVMSREDRQKTDEPEEPTAYHCSHKGCTTLVNPEDPYYATPCGSYCSQHMREHVKSCEICRGEFDELES